VAVHGKQIYETVTDGASCAPTLDTVSLKVRGHRLVFSRVLGSHESLLVGTRQGSAPAAWRQGLGHSSRKQLSVYDAPIFVAVDNDRNQLEVHDAASRF
jgi:hypothetical protein